VRRVACYAATSFLRTTETPQSVAAAVISIVERWLGSKGVTKLPSGRAETRLKDGRDAISHFDHIALNEEFVWDVSLEESTDTGRFFTRICLGTSNGRAYLFVELRAGGDGMLVAPVNVDVHCPHVLRKLLESRVWTVGNTPAITKAITWHGEESAKRFMAVVKHIDRNLPIVAISRHDGETLVPSMAADLARDLCGLAMVVDLDESASWAITKTFGREWSCYNGALRLFWPFRGKHAGAFNHPIWRRELLIEKAGGAVKAALRIRNQLRRQLLELSTYTFDEPRDFFRIRAEAQRSKFEELRQEAERTGDQEKLAEHYFSESDRLQTQVFDQQSEIERLRAQVSGLNEALRYKAQSDKDDEISPESEIPIETVRDAVDRARETFSDTLLFGDDIDAGIDDLPDDAGPPERIYTYLKTLAEMTRQRTAGGLGKDMVIWLKELGLKASGESDSILNDQVEMRKRTWHDGHRRRPFEKHLKPTDATSNDRCVRIYFDFDESLRKTVVAYIGRHP
jgi:hypothetical protein